MQDDRRAHFGWRWQAFRLVSDSTAHPCVITRGSFPTLIFPTAACNRMQRNASSRKKFAHPLTYFPTPEAPKNTLIPAFSHTRHALRRSAVPLRAGEGGPSSAIGGEWNVCGGLIFSFRCVGWRDY